MEMQDIKLRDITMQDLKTLDTKTDGMNCSFALTLPGASSQRCSLVVLVLYVWAFLLYSWRLPGYNGN